MFDATEFSRIVSATERLTAELDRLQKSMQPISLFTERIGSLIQRIDSPFEQMLLHDRLMTHVGLLDVHSRLEAGLKRHSEARVLVSASLPKRGWYLSGEEPCTLSLTLADAVRAQDWERVDQELLEHVPEFKPDALSEWLAQEGVPGYCANRVRLAVRHYQEKNYEEATYLGVPLLDEIAQYLYKGKTFSTKRGNKRRGDQSKPELAFKTPGGPELNSYCEHFVQAFGSLQEDPNPKALADENYWNRHAIVHGMMQRAMGLKDSAKCLTALGFLFFARKEEPEKK